MRNVLIILIIGVFSCKSQKNKDTVTTNDDLVLLEQEGFSSFDTFETMVVKDQKTLNAFYTKINKTRKPGLPVPLVDFSKEMVLIVCMGEQVGNDLPDLVKGEENENEITLRITQGSSQKEGHTSLMSSPFCVYKMPLTDKRILFLDQ